MSIRNQAYFWLGAFILLGGFLYLFNNVLLPFVLGAAIAYLLNPLVRAMSKLKIARGPASLMILSGFLFFISLVLLIISPLLYKQSVQLYEELPDYISRLAVMAEPLTYQLAEMMGQDTESVDLGALFKDVVSKHWGAALSSAGGMASIVAGSVAASGQALIDLISVLVFMPLVAYFLMIEWPKIMKWGEDILPRDHKETILDLLSQINQKIAGFVRGQISVAFLLGIIYAVALTIAGLKYGFLIGLMAGLLSIIPMVGSLVGLVVSVVVAWFQSGELGYVALIGGIFLAGQILEGNVITPKLIGDSVGLHPLWIFFSLLAGGSLFGIVGMFLAVPVAASLGVLFAFALNLYKASIYYTGSGKNLSADEETQGNMDG